jgi:nucleolar MIF4G domain-containing protein 1
LQQEKSYNPYYALVCQHLCRSSHSYKITLQFCLWDFLRDLGEANVGGAEVIKNLKDDRDEGAAFDVKSISSTRIRNVAKAYAWWVAKDCVTLAILKVCRRSILVKVKVKI